MNPIEKVKELYQSGYLLYCIPGVVRYVQLKRLKKRFGFDSWHVSPKELRLYALDLIRYLNMHVGANSVVVEIGCGIGEIIRSIERGILHGYDIDPKVIEAARCLDRAKRVFYRIGSFEQVAGLEIDYLIAVNFIHNIPPQKLRKELSDLCVRNTVRNLVLDRVDDKAYAYHHGPEVVPSEYSLVYSSRYFTFDRRIFVYERIDGDLE